jgi:membrane protein YqaA with SNARE-associated domain
VDDWIPALLGVLALPQYGLVTVFLVSLLSATLLPMASLPVVYGLVELNPSLLWPTLFVATAGNTLGGAISYWMGYGAEAAYEKLAHKEGGHTQVRALAWLERWGPRACLLSWLPFIGDPLCAVAGWLRLPFWPCVAYMAIGKFLRYVVYVFALIWALPNPFA